MVTCKEPPCHEQIFLKAPQRVIAFTGRKEEEPPLPVLIDGPDGADGSIALTCEAGHTHLYYFTYGPPA